MTGCKERKCPCRMWVQCKEYMDKKRQEDRLKINSYEDLHVWYDIFFREHISDGSALGVVGST